MKAKFNRTSKSFDPQVLLPALTAYQSFEYPESFSPELVEIHRNYTKNTLEKATHSFEKREDFHFTETDLRTISIALSAFLETVETTKKPLKGLTLSATVSRIQANLRLTDTIMNTMGISL